MSVAADSGSGALIVDTHGRVLFINPVAARIYGRRAPRDVIGGRLLDLIPQSAAVERLDAIRVAIGSSEPVHARELWGGWALRWTIRAIPNPADPGTPAALVLCTSEAAFAEESPEPAGRTIEFKHVDFGSLAGLTTSELKVMALIGEGLSNAEIAARLHRAVKTVESHRAALTEKTGTASRVQLGIMARRAGLLRRVTLSDGEPSPARVSV